MLTATSSHAPRQRRCLFGDPPALSWGRGGRGEPLLRDAHKSTAIFRGVGHRERVACHADAGNQYPPLFGRHGQRAVCRHVLRRQPQRNDHAGRGRRQLHLFPDRPHRHARRRGVAVDPRRRQPVSRRNQAVLGSGGRDGHRDCLCHRAGADARHGGSVDCAPGLLRGRRRRGRGAVRRL